MPANGAAFVPLKAIAELLGLDPGTVRNWRYRGWLDEAGNRHFVRVKDRKYSAADVIRAERDTYLSSQSHRTRPLIAA
jgi:uncharacterized protein YjcR